MPWRNQVRLLRYILEKKQLIDFPYVRQFHNYDCGSACTFAILTWYGKDTREDKVLKKLHTTKVGTSKDSILDLCKKNQINCQEKYGVSVKELKGFLDQGRPVIMAIQAWPSKKAPKDWEDNNDEGHYVIAIGYDDDQIIFEDPASIERTFLTVEQLDRRWHDTDLDNTTVLDHWCIVFSPSPYKFSTDKLVQMG